MQTSLPLDPALTRLKELHAIEVEFSRNRNFDIFGKGIGLKAFRLHERFVRLAEMRIHEPSFAEAEDGTVEMVVRFPSIDATEHYFLSAARYAYFRRYYWDADS